MLLNTSACQIPTAFDIMVQFGRMMKTSIALHDREEAAGRVFPNNNVRRTFQCRTFFPKAA